MFYDVWTSFSHVVDDVALLWREFGKCLAPLRNMCPMCLDLCFPFCLFHYLLGDVAVIVILIRRVIRIGILKNWVSHERLGSFQTLGVTWTFRIRVCLPYTPLNGDRE